MCQYIKFWKCGGRRVGGGVKSKLFLKFHAVKVGGKGVMCEILLEHNVVRMCL